MAIAVHQQVLLRVRAAAVPALLRHCPRCHGQRPFSSSGRFRVNANGRRIDIWLIYGCQRCGFTYNHPIWERAPLRGLAPALLQAFELNDPAAARRHAFEAARSAPSESPEVVVEADEPVALQGGTELQLCLEEPVRVRLDRLIALALGMSRERIARLARTAVLQVTPGGRRALRRTAKSGQRITFTSAAG